jgi:hypothetical protein
VGRDRVLPSQGRSPITGSALAERSLPSAVSYSLPLPIHFTNIVFAWFDAYKTYKWHYSGSLSHMQHQQPAKRVERQATVKELAFGYRAPLRTAAKIVLFFAAAFLCYSLILASTDKHRLKSSANCRVCQFTQNLYCGDDAENSVVLEVPAHHGMVPVTPHLLHFSKSLRSSSGSRSPPYLLPAAEGRAASVVTS